MYTLKYLLIVICCGIFLGCTDFTTTSIQAGNGSGQSPGGTTTPDTTPPSAPTITSPAQNSTRTIPTGLNISGVCETASIVRVTGDITALSVTQPCSNSLYAIQVTLSSSNGSKSLQVVQTDTAGNVSQPRLLTVLLDVATPPPPQAPPMPTITSPANNSTQSSASGLVVTGGCQTSNLITISGNISPSNATTTCEGSMYLLTVNLSLGNGIKSLQVIQTNSSGLASQPRSWTVNLNIPTPPPVDNPNWTSTNFARVFLSGHSLTDKPLIDYVENLASSNSDNFNYNQQIVIGSPMRVRTKGDNPNASNWPGYSAGKNRNGSTGLNIINELRNPQTIGAGSLYDTLVVTENHNSLPQIQWENTIPYLRHYHDLLRSGNSNARTLFYHSWLDIDKTNPNPWITHEKNARVTWECAVSKVNQSLGDNSPRPQVQSLPTGAALVDLVERLIANQVNGLTGTNLEKLNQIFSDNVHLTSTGMYYVALVTYAAVFRKSPIGSAAPVGMNSTLATSLQTIAWNYVNNYYNQSSPGVQTMANCRAEAATYCNSFWTLKGETSNINGCTNFFSSNSAGPFADQNFTPFPAP